MSRLLSKLPPLAINRSFSTSIPIQSKHTFLVVLHDYQDSECLQRRKNVREQHLVDAKETAVSGTILAGGAVLDNHESGIMKGSMLLLSAESVEEVDKIITNDIYYKGKVWEKWEVYPYKGAIGPFT